MTADIQLYREDTGEMAVVRFVDGHQPARADRPTHMDLWDAIERRAADAVAALAEGLAAQAKAEMRNTIGEQFHQHRAVRMQIAERVCREGTVNLPPRFEEIAPVWAVLPPSVDDLVGIDPDWTGELSTDEYIQRQRAERQALLDNLVRNNRPIGWTPERPAVLAGPAPADDMHGVEAGPRSRVGRAADNKLARLEAWLRARFTPVKEEQ